jgi:2-phospho-L-lactate guanylyltransferase (CobY/MobA/RfbA family)
MKPNKNFKMNKTIKSFLSSILSDVERNSFKRAMIDAQLCSEIVPQKQDKDKK